MPARSLMRAPHVAGALLGIWVAGGAAARASQAQAPTRIETNAALAQLVTRVDPVVPPEAEQAGVGGTVVADVIVGAAGRVTSVTILAGPEMLHAAAEAALRQWIFVPFVIDGEPRPVLVLLDVDFPDPVRDQERRAHEAFRAALYACERQLDIDPVQAVDSCRAAVAAAERLPGAITEANIIGALERARRVYLRSLVLSGRLPEALETVQQLIEIRARTVTRADAVSAGDYRAFGLLQQRLGAYEEAERALKR